MIYNKTGFRLVSKIHVNVNLPDILLGGAPTSCKLVVGF